ncbi:hypothetical protein NEDG_01121 [Nematocida displodere]|uniref:Uncharacterized protein n=1 Tax=Nematocida displodere TaxID=1805483 RepID=A0A177ECU2_9MICR|nr:hypothetical protein NEDG_01121 [Nematocida displodere]
MKQMSIRRVTRVIVAAAFVLMGLGRCQAGRNPSYEQDLFLLEQLANINENELDQYIDTNLYEETREIDRHQLKCLAVTYKEARKFTNLLHLGNQEEAGPKDGEDILYL